MRNNIQLHTESIKAKKSGVGQRVWAYLVVLPLVLFTLSGYTVIPNTIQPLNLTMETTIPLTFQKGATLTQSAGNVSCSDIITLEQFSGSEMKIYFNDCALQHLTALAATASAAAASIGFVSLWCSDCAPVAAGIATIAAWVTANIATLQYASQQCGGAFLDISWDGGVQFEPACST